MKKVKIVSPLRLEDSYRQASEISIIAQDYLRTFQKEMAEFVPSPGYPAIPYE